MPELTWLRSSSSSNSRRYWITSPGQSVSRACKDRWLVSKAQSDTLRTLDEKKPTPKQQARNMQAAQGSPPHLQALLQRTVRLASAVQGEEAVERSAHLCVAQPPGFLQREQGQEAVWGFSSAAWWSWSRGWRVGRVSWQS